MENTILQPTLQKAVEFAAKKHAGQLRKGSTYPYITHVVEAMEIVSRMTEDENLRAAAVLHDTLEDTCTTKEELVREFGQRIADLVDSESEDKRRGQSEKASWKVRKQETIDHLAKAPTEIRMLALGDKLSNIRAMYRDYQVVGEHLWKKFNNSDPRKQGTYYWLLGKAFKDDPKIRETPAFKEYNELCMELFGAECYQDGEL